MVLFSLVSCGSGERDDAGVAVDSTATPSDVQVATTSGVNSTVVPAPPPAQGCPISSDSVMTFFGGQFVLQPYDGFLLCAFNDPSRLDNVGPVSVNLALDSATPSSSAMESDTAAYSACCSGRYLAVERADLATGAYLVTLSADDEHPIWSWMYAIPTPAGLLRITINWPNVFIDDSPSDEQRNQFVVSVLPFFL